MSKPTKKYSNENSNLQNKKPATAHPTAASVLRDSTNLSANIADKSSVLLDTPSSSKEMSDKQKIIYTNDEIPFAQIRTAVPPLRSNPNPNHNSKFNSPFKPMPKTAQQPGKARNKKGAFDEDLVNLDFDPDGKGANSSRIRGGSSSRRSNRSQSGEETINITPRQKMEEMRQRKKESSTFEVQITNVKLEEIQKELKNMNVSGNLTKTGSQMKESIIRLRSMSKESKESKENKEELNLMQSELSSKESKVNESKAISPLKRAADETQAIISTMEEKCEKESEEVRAKVSEIESQLTLEEKLVHKIWQVRRNAYAEIGKMFVSNNGDASKLSEYYASWLRYMLDDNNLIALHEGLNTVLIYVKNSSSVATAVGLVPGLLDKMPIHKPQFQEKVTEILCEFVKRDQAQYVVSELIGRFTARKNAKGSPFSVNCLISMLNSKLYEKIELKQVYKAAINAINNTLKEVRGPIIKLLQTIFELVEDSAEQFTSKMPEGTKPFVIKELIETLKTTNKSPISNKIMLLIQENKPSTTSNIKNVAVANEQKKTPNTQPMRKDRLKELNEQKKVISQVAQHVEVEIVNLNDHVNEEVFKLMYITKAEEKKAKIEELNKSLEKLVQKACKIEKKDYSALVNILCTLLDDNNVFLQLEVLKSLQLLSTLLNKEMAALKPKQIVGKLLDRLKENKTNIIYQIETTIVEMLQNDCVSPEGVIDTVMQKIGNSKNPRIRQFSLQLLCNRLLGNKKAEEMNSKAFIPSSIIQHAFPNIIGPKLLTVIQKDPVAGVRDLAVQLLTKIKIQCPASGEVEKVIAKLPKARIQEINAKVKTEVQQSKSREASPAIKIMDNISELKRSNSELKLVRMKSDESQNCNKDLMKVAETGTCNNLIIELKDFSEEQLIENKQQILFSITYCLTKKTGGKLGKTVNGTNLCPANESQANLLSRIICTILSNGETTDQDLDCAISCGIIISSVITAKDKHSILRQAYKSKDIEQFVLSLQKVLHTFKYSDENDMSMTTGMNAYKIVAEWLLQDFESIKAADTDKLISVLNISSGMGFKKEFINCIEKIKQQLTAKNVKAVHSLKHQTHLQQILDGINQKETQKNKKAVDSLSAFLDEVTNSQSGMINTFVKEIVQGLCSLITKAQWFEDDVLNVLNKFRVVISSDEASKTCKSMMQTFADYMQPDAKNAKLLSYYKTLNLWAKEMAKKEITMQINETFVGCSFSFKSGTENNRFIMQLRALINWLSTQILGEFFYPEDIEPILTYIIRGLKSAPALKQECEYLLSKCYKVFGIRKAQTWLEESLAQSQPLYKIYAEWHDTRFNIKEEKKQEKKKLEEIKHEEKKIEEKKVDASKDTLPQMIAKLASLSSSDCRHVSFDSNSYTPNESPSGNPNPITEKNAMKEDTLKNSVAVHKCYDSLEASQEFKESHAKAEKIEQVEEQIKNEIKDTDCPILQAVISPRFGSELDKTKEKKEENKLDTPLSMKELDNNANETRAEKFKFPITNPITHDVVIKLPQNIPKAEHVTDALVSCFTSKTIVKEKMEIATGLNTALNSEDLLQVIPTSIIQGLIEACLRMSTIEKIRIMGSTDGLKEIVSASNAVVTELQSSLTKLMNSRSFTTIIEMLLSALKESLPDDFSAELKQEQIVYLKLVMVCLQRIYKASLKDLRTFSVLLSLYRLFGKHPPEKLKQNLPSLSVFDFVYKMLREITDNMVENDVEKSVSFVTWIESETEASSSTFLKYLKTVVAKTLGANQSQDQNQDSEQ